MKHSSDPEWMDVLGDSMTRITNMISQNEIKEALAQGFMTETQAWELSKAKEQAQANSLSTKDSKSHSRRR